MHACSQYVRGERERDTPGGRLLRSWRLRKLSSNCGSTWGVSEGRSTGTVGRGRTRIAPSLTPSTIDCRDSSQRASAASPATTTPSNPCCSISSLHSCLPKGHEQVGLAEQFPTLPAMVLHCWHARGVKCGGILLSYKELELSGGLKRNLVTLLIISLAYISEIY